MSSLYRAGFLPAHRLLALALASVLTAPLAAQDPQAAFDAGMQAYRAGDFEAAIAKFREVVAMEPDNTTALAMMHDSQDELLQLLMEGGEFETFAKEVLAAAGKASVEALRDPEAARAAAAGVFGEQYAARAKAIFELRTKFGPFAVPPLVAKLTSSSESERSHAIYALSRLGTEATVPLLASTWSEVTEVRMGALLALASLDDPRAVARAADLATSDPDGAVRVLAGRMAAGADAAQANYEQGWAYYVHDPAQGLSDVENHGGLWQIERAKLEFRDLPAGLVPLALAKQSYARAHALGQPQARVGLALASGTSVAVLQGLVDAGNADAVALRDAEALAAQSLGQPALDAALAMALEREDVATASALVRLLDGPGLMARNGLRAAVDSAVPSVRLHAAQALANGGDSSADVVAVLTDALRLQALRVVVLADDNAARRSALAEALGRSGTVVLSSGEGAGGMLNFRRSSHVDAVVIADPLPGMYARRFVKEVRKDPRKGEVPVFVLGNEQTGDIEGAEVVTEVLTAEAVVGAFGALNGERAQYAAFAQQAASTLAQIAKYRPEALAGSLDALAGVVNREDEVAGGALRALASAGGADQLAAAMGVVADTTRSATVRAAAAEAVAGILSRHPGAEVDGAVLTAAAAEGEPALAQAAARALALAGGAATAGVRP